MMNAKAPQIVLLNGVGSAGKSSIARELQRIASRAFLHVQMDAFLDMLPAAYHCHGETFAYETVSNGGPAEAIIHTGPLGERLLKGMRHAIRGMADQGLDLIVDDVLMGANDIGHAEYAELMRPFRFHRVGVLASLDVLEARERARGDRMIGLARWQFERVHDGMAYDLEVDTSAASPSECADRIKQAFQL
jgi:chloramphenicol 3-O phosphotransferase